MTKTLKVHSLKYTCVVDTLKLWGCTGRWARENGNKAGDTRLSRRCFFLDWPDSIVFFFPYIVVAML